MTIDDSIYRHVRRTLSDNGAYLSLNGEMVGPQQVEQMVMSEQLSRDEAIHRIAEKIARGD